MKEEAEKHRETSDCVCVFGESRRCYESAPCHHHLIKHRNGRQSYLSKQETNESEAVGGGESENDIMENNGACYYVTGFQKTVKSLCTYAYIHSLHRHTHIQAHTQKRSRGFPECPPPPKSCSRSVKPPSF